MASARPDRFAAARACSGHRRCPGEGPSRSGLPMADDGLDVLLLGAALGWRPPARCCRDHRRCSPEGRGTLGALAPLHGAARSQQRGLWGTSSAGSALLSAAVTREPARSIVSISAAEQEQRWLRAEHVGVAEVDVSRSTQHRVLRRLVERQHCARGQGDAYGHGRPVGRRHRGRRPPRVALVDEASSCASRRSPRRSLLSDLPLARRRWRLTRPLVGRRRRGDVTREGTGDSHSVT